MSFSNRFCYSKTETVMLVFTVSCFVNTVKAFKYLFAVFFGNFITFIYNRKNSISVFLS